MLTSFILNNKNGKMLFSVTESYNNMPISQSGDQAYDTTCWAANLDLSLNHRKVFCPVLDQHPKVDGQQYDGNWQTGRRVE